jgi:hypothetical protein
MPLRRSALVLAFSAVATLAGCNSDSSSGPPAKPDRALLDGDYDCSGFQAYTVGPQGPGYYEGSCNAYLTFANPALADSGRTYPFSVASDNSVSRLDYPQGTLAYDTTAVIAVVSYPGLPPDQYEVEVDNTFTYFRQKLVFDFSGDARIDTLYLLFTNRR